MKHIRIVLGCIFACGVLLNSGNADEKVAECVDDAKTIKQWRIVREIADSIDANRMALSLSACLASPNSELRDKIAYEVLTYWLRNDKLDEEVIFSLRERLLRGLSRRSEQTETDAAIERAFSALVLSELVRDDSSHKRWSDDQFTKTLEHAITMFEQERDYRGLDPEIGWIHTIAHGSDLLWRLAIHPNISGQQQESLLAALSTQIARPGAPAYVFNEADRLARVAYSIFAQQKVELDLKTKWIDQIGSPAPLQNWGGAFASTAGMARLHNTKQFLRALRESVQSTKLNKVKEAIDKSLGDLS
jgi:hypothetical protein